MLQCAIYFKLNIKSKSEAGQIGNTRDIREKQLREFITNLEAVPVVRTVRNACVD